ncbi:hypothetical protein P8C59_002860 [Phyllachora maydis]|uniref:Cysteine synthase 2 n=1 Tax=Phyllachora maydis TaxID=1825666 RepID=A0AAD9M8H4_9PEZI|nr:hypothetical protein P8C59_002860 [Phyllachora maydis]
MSLSEHARLYSTAAIAVAFAAGILVTLGFKDVYPDLERNYQQNRKQARGHHSHAPARRSSLFFGPVELEDRDSPAVEAAKPLGSLHHLPPPAAAGIEATIGNTPLVQIRSLSAATGRVILAKAELLNGAGGSPKDRVALHVLRDAEARGLLDPARRGDTVYEGTVGSTGISLATLARARGYRAHICMPDDQSAEKAELLLRLGATVERVPVAPIASPDHFVNLARRRAAQHAARHADGTHGFFADQFENPANWAAHAASTGPEIWTQTGGRLAAFVAGAGTGGTIAGVAKYLKEERRATDVRIVLADPQGSGLYNRVRHGVMYSATEREGTRRRQQVDTVVEGVGINRITANFEAGRELVDDAVRVTDEQAMRMARWLVENDGIFIGSSSAVNCVAAVVTALSLPEGSEVVTVLCDSGTRHLSKFWKRVAEDGLEHNEEGPKRVVDPPDLLQYLGLDLHK